MAVSLTGTNSIDSLLTGDSWSGSVGQSATVSYAFGTYVGGNRDLAAVTNPSSIPQAFITAAQSAMQLWSNVANISYQYHPGAGNQPLMLGYTDGSLNPATDAGIAITYPAVPVSKIATVDIEVSPTNEPLSDFPAGNYGFLVMIHELGHALGLKHPFEASDIVTNNAILPTAQDNLNNTVMSYTEGDLATDNTPPQTPMIYDIQAAQYLYGANHNYHSGNDVYSYAGAQYAGTIWDGAGTDTISSQGYGGNATIDLREGINNTTIIGSTHLWIAFGANLESATTGNGNDTVYANDLGDYVTTAKGSDTISGGAGADTLYSGQGYDTIHAGQGDDLANGNKGNDLVYGDAGNNTLYGGQGNDTIYGGAGNNLISGDMGNDLLYASGSGNNTFAFNGVSGNDTISDFNAAVDHLQFSHLQFKSVAAAEAATLYQSNGVVLIRIDAGNSVSIVGLTSHLPEADIAII